MDMYLRNTMNKRNLIMVILGSILILIGIPSVFIGIASLLFKWQHDVSFGIVWGIYSILAGYGIIRSMKWGILMVIVPLLKFILVDLELLFKKSSATTSYLYIGLFISICIIVALLTQWKKCRWKISKVIKKEGQQL